MRTDQLFQQKTVFSYEVFPPKATTSLDTIYTTLERMKGQQPDFISVTLGAGGSVKNLQTVEIAHKIQTEQFLPSVAHLPAIHFTKAEILTILAQLKVKKIDNILALRGDIIPGKPTSDDFIHAADLVSFIKEHGAFNIIGACYPETHLEAKNAIEDIRFLKEKVEAGTSQLVSQLFFDNQYFYRFLERCALAQIEVPIQAGIMPVVNKKQIERITKMSHVTLPEKFLKMMARYEHNPEAIRDAGIAYAVDQIVDLVAQGVDGIHLYTMNNPYVAKRIREATRSLFETPSLALIAE